MKSIEIFVVTLKKYSNFSKFRTERLISLLKDKFPSFQMNIRYIGINGLKLKNKKIIEKYMTKDYSDKVLWGDKGCSLSHVCIFKLIQINKLYSDVFVFEEDAMPTNSNFELIIKRFPQDYHLVSLHSYSDLNFYQQLDPNKKTVEEKDRIENIFFDFRKIIHPVIWPVGASCYVINGRKIEEIVKNILPLGSPIDSHIWSNYHNMLNKYIINPEIKLCSSSDGKSIRHIIDLHGIKK